MKNYFKIIVLYLSINCTTTFAQTNTNKLSLELTKFKLGINAGPYRGRTQETDEPFNQGISFLGQMYFPFQVSYGASETTESNEYSNKTMLLRPSIILHIVDNGSFAYGGAMQISVRTFNQFYIEYQLGTVYLEAKEGASPDLHDGMNLHHYLSISKSLNQTFTISFGFIHISKGGFNSKTSNQDVLAIGIKYNL